MKRALKSIDKPTSIRYYRAAADECVLTGAVSDKETFCQVWPQAKEGLTLLRSILQFVPGVGVFAAPAIGIVTATGDAVQKGLCH
jgi:hypothetical protein